MKLLVGEGGGGAAGSKTTADELDRLVAELAAASLAPSTLRAYRSDWRVFSHFCAERAERALPATAATIARFVADEHRLGRAPSTIDRRLAAISAKHRDAGLDCASTSAEVRRVRQGLRRQMWTTRSLVADPVDPGLLATLIRACENTDVGLRNRSILSLMFATGLRASETVALDRGDIQTETDGLTINVRRSKTDQEGLGAVIGARKNADRLLCAVEALAAYDTVRPRSEALFVNGRRGGHLGADRLTTSGLHHVVAGFRSQVPADFTLTAHPLFPSRLRHDRDPGRRIANRGCPDNAPPGPSSTWGLLPPRPDRSRTPLRLTLTGEEWLTGPPGRVPTPRPR